MSKFVDIVIGIFIMLILTIMAISVIIIIISVITEKDMYIVETECFDKKGNEIINQSCKKIIRCGYLQQSYTIKYPCNHSEYNGIILDVVSEGSE